MRHAVVRNNPAMFLLQVSQAHIVCTEKENKYNNQVTMQSCGVQESTFDNICGQKVDHEAHSNPYDTINIMWGIP